MRNRDHSNISKKGKENLENARNERKIPIILVKNDICQQFDSISSASTYISNNYDINWEKVRYKFKRRYPEIFGYTVKYVS